MKINNYLNRYTTLPFLLDILTRKEISLLNPELWEDRNDLHCIEQYKANRKCLTVLGLCFSSVRETFHHWKIFSNGSSGVCIEFDKKKLLTCIPKGKGFRHGPVEYHTVTKIEQDSIEIERVPFLKRWAYRDEKEYRILYENSDEIIQAKPISIDLKCINKVTLSPWLPKPVSDTVTDVIKSLDGCSSLKVNRSNLIEYNRWKEAITNGCPKVQKGAARSPSGTRVAFGAASLVAEQ